MAAGKLLRCHSEVTLDNQKVPHPLATAVDARAKVLLPEQSVCVSSNGEVNLFPLHLLFCRIRDLLVSSLVRLG